MRNAATDNYLKVLQVAQNSYEQNKKSNQNQMSHEDYQAAKESKTHLENTHGHFA